ncbi:hypothetical protein ABIA69_000185 [Lysinibacillus parviboronicapiens]|uniref:DUF4044 domain-containing protein n=1 Tax=Lysinibacillus parviboronicapiens TaxID=436516 RepID=A0ABV2PDP1_9BACI
MEKSKGFMITSFTISAVFLVAVITTIFGV